MRSRRTVEPARVNTRRGSSPHPNPAPQNHCKARDRPRTFRCHKGPSLQAHRAAQTRSALALLDSSLPTLVGRRPRGPTKGYPYRLREPQKCLPTLPCGRQTSTHAMRVEGKKRLGSQGSPKSLAICAQRFLISSSRQISSLAYTFDGLRSPVACPHGICDGLYQGNNAHVRQMMLPQFISNTRLDHPCWFRDSEYAVLSAYPASPP